jgi:hypothetical protein
MENKKKYKVLATYSEAATLKLDIYDISGVNVDEFIQLHLSDLKQGHDWNLKEFDTKAEAIAYAEGIEDANGWADPYAILL